MRVRKLQVLSHHYLISSSIEIYVGDSYYGGSASLETVQFKRLGHVDLSDNERTGQQARELKSVRVDAMGLYVKLSLHKNYYHQRNTYNQVIYQDFDLCV